ncbi:hypothetical protein B0H11DRAFT_1807255 [Mycena galericulata]|nr:hypothetical protein B0H11DRAFT_1807255 [Mycena galericulata]
MSVIVDDHDPRVQYTPSTGWTTKGKPVEYMSTTTASTTPGNTATFSFEGTSLTVYGTVGPSKGQGATMSFSIDNELPTTFTAPGSNSSTVHHEVLWDSGTLADGNHTLLITQTSKVEQIFLDYFLYETTSTAGQTIFVDDNDDSMKFSSNWALAPSSEELFQNTGHVCQESECTLSFTFEGTSLQLYGAIPTGSDGSGFNSSVAIDEGTHVPITLDQPEPTLTGNFLLFTSPTELSPGNHTMLLTTHNVDQFLVDYILFTSQADPSTASPARAPPISPSAAGEAGVAGVASPNHNTSKSFPIAAVVGGVVGGLVFLALIFVAALLWRRRKRRLNVDQPTFIPQWIPQERPQSIMSVATLLGDGAAPGPGPTQKGGEFHKSESQTRPMSRYLYYSEN